MIVQDFHTGDMLGRQVLRCQGIIAVEHLQPLDIEIADSPPEIADLTALRYGYPRDFFQSILERYISSAHQGWEIEAERISNPCHHGGTDNRFLQLRLLLL